MVAPVFVEGEYRPFEFFVEDANGRLDLSLFQDAELKTDVGTESVGFLAPTLGHAVATRVTYLPKPDGIASRSYKGRVGLRMERAGVTGRAPHVYASENLDITVLPSTIHPQLGDKATWRFESFAANYPVAWIRDTESGVIIPHPYFGPSPTDPVSGYVASSATNGWAVKTSGSPYPWLVKYPFTKCDHTRLTVDTESWFTGSGFEDGMEHGWTISTGLGWTSPVGAEIFLGSGDHPRIWGELLPNITVVVIDSALFLVIIADGRPTHPYTSNGTVTATTALIGGRPARRYEISYTTSLITPSTPVFRTRLNRATRTVSVTAGSQTTTFREVDVDALLNASTLLCACPDLTGQQPVGQSTNQRIPRVSWEWDTP